MEIWKEVYGYDTLYEVSNLGRVRTKRDHAIGYTPEYRFVTPRDNGKGYLAFNFHIRGLQRTVYLHRLVAIAFVDNPLGLTEVNHINEDKTDCRAINLEWCTHAYNCRYGSRNIRAAEKNSKPIVCIETGIRYVSVTEAARQLGCAVTSISNHLAGRTKTSQGYHWRYDE